MDVSYETRVAAEAVIDLVAEGKSLQDAISKMGTSVKLFYKAISSVRTLGLAYAHARETQSDIAVDQAVTIADDPDIDPQRAKNMIDIRKWRASKHHSRVYGDRVELNFQGSISINDAIAEARQRIAPIVMDADRKSVV